MKTGSFSWATVGSMDVLNFLLLLLLIGHCWLNERIEFPPRPPPPPRRRPFFTMPAYFHRWFSRGTKTSKQWPRVCDVFCLNMIRA